MTDKDRTVKYRLRMPKRSVSSRGLKTKMGQDLRSRNRVWLLMTLPAALWILLFRYLTMVGVGIAFVDFKPRKGIFGSDFVGLQNFTFLFSTDAVLQATLNTVLLNLLFIVVTLAFSLALAFLMFQIYSSSISRVYQAVLLLPNFISYVIVSYFVFALLATDNGMVNGVLQGLGMPRVAWYTEPQYWPTILLITHLWTAMGWGSLIYLAAMLGIDNELFEAAEMDGAGRGRQFWSITLPIILPIVVINVLLALGSIFNADFGLFFLVTRNQGLLYPTTDVLDTYIYRALTTSGDWSMASAAQFYQSVVGFLLLLTANRLVKRIGGRDRDLSLM